jgi:hypothetical protein
MQFAGPASSQQRRAEGSLRKRFLALYKAWLRRTGGCDKAKIYIALFQAALRFVRAHGSVATASRTGIDGSLCTVQVAADHETRQRPRTKKLKPALLRSWRPCGACRIFNLSKTRACRTGRKVV